MSAEIKGTREWATKSVNCCIGCSHGCLYCYARYNALVRFKRIANGADWTTERLCRHQLRTKWPRYSGRVMFPTTHDITEGNLQVCAGVLAGLLAAGNQVLIVSKPSPGVIGRLCDAFTAYRQQITFRFSIGMLTDTIRDFWEPGAPMVWDRLATLAAVDGRGFQTSVSCEPLLEVESAAELVERVSPFVTDTIWIGKANQLRARTAWCMPANHPAILGVEAGQTDEAVRDVYSQLRHHPKVRWKDSYKKVIGLPLAERPGTDQ